MLKKILIIIGMILLLSTVCTAGKINVKRLSKVKWVYLEAENFYVLSDAKEEEAIEIVREMENFKYFLGYILKHGQNPLPEKVSVLAAKNQSSFKSIGIPNGYAGLFLGGYAKSILVRCDGFIPSSKDKYNYGRSTVLHELVHLFLHNTSAEFAIPPWYDEGIAEYFSTYYEKDGNAIVGSVRVMRNRFRSLFKPSGAFKNFDTESLFKTTRKEMYTGNRSISHFLSMDEFYARSFIVVSYLFGDNSRREKLSNYLSSLKKGLSVDESFEKAFKMTFGEFDQEVDGYIQGRSKILTFNLKKTGIEFPDIEYKKHEISKEDALAFLFKKISMLSDNLLGDGNYDKFICDMERLNPGLIDNTIEQIEDDIKNKEQLLTVGMICLRAHRHREAIEIYKKALLLDQNDAYVLNNYAWILITASDKELRNPEKAIDLAERSVAIERTSTSLDTLAEAYYANRSFQKAIETINEAISLSKEENKYLNKQLKKFKDAQEKL